MVSLLQIRLLMKNAPFWPELNYEDWNATRQTLQRWTQIVGKVRLSKTPWINHSWHATLYVTERGLTTDVIHDPDTSFSLSFDFISHHLQINRGDGTSIALPLRAEPVAAFYRRCVSALDVLGIETPIVAKPNELPDALPFPVDQVHRTYDPECANRFWRALLHADRVMRRFRSRFLGKVSPVHFFWGGFDLAVTRFSGRRAPEHPGGIPHLPDIITREAYSHEVSSCGFWPGDVRFPRAAFYSYAYPEPPGFESVRLPGGAFFHSGLREFILPYDVVRSSSSPDRLLLDFFQDSYEAAANLGHWDRALLEESRYLRILQAGAA